MAYQGQTYRDRNGLTHFDAEAALHLVQAFHRELDLERFLGTLFSQMNVLTDARGIRFEYRDLGIDVLVGQRERHTAEYNLTYSDDDLGTLTLFFARRAQEQDIQTVEDLLALVVTAIRNCLTVVALQNETKPHQAAAPETSTPSSNQSAPNQSASSEEDQQSLREDRKSDALILIALDDYDAIKSRDGEAWANTIMSSMHSEILSGLRTSDGVYQISEALVAVLLPNTTLTTAEEVATKIRGLIAGLHLNSENQDQRLTACMGITNAEHAVTADDVMTNARSALTKAQAQGADRIEVFPTPFARD
jgi:diguanylate cyclase (GGDEF)-like protein